tara:strand:+ start:413 stop:2059 length:1647 start_codon:yes stop_codon:yes gene_type:complete
MANPKIKVKRSSVVGKVPQPTQLERGELAVNSYDGKVYIVKDQFSVGIATTTTTVNPWLETGIGVGLSYSGDVKIVGILTVGSSSLTLDGTNNTVKVGTALTLGHSQGLQFHTQNLHSTGFEVNNINVSGASTFTGAIDANGNLDVDGTTSLDALTVDEDATFNADIELVSTDSGSSAGPIIDLYRNSSSAADADYLGQIKFQGENDAGQKIVYSKITGKILDASDGTEDGILEFAFKKAGSNNISGRFRSDSLQLLNGTNFTVAGESTFTGRVTANHGVTGNINSTGISTVSGFTFPSSDGSEDQALVTDGNGSLSFKTLSGGGGGAVGGATTISTSNTVATQGQTAFTAPNVFDDGEQATTFSVQVSINGVKQRLGASNDYQLAAPQTVTFNSGLTAGDNVQISVYFGHTFEEEFFTATQNQATFTLSGSLAAAKNYRVFLNGVRLRRDIDYQASSAVVLAEACRAGDEVDICSDQAEDQLTANAGQSSFAPSNSDTSSDNMEVYLNGILLQRTVDWTIGSPAITIINPASGLDLGDELDVVVRRS